MIKKNQFIYYGGRTGPGRCPTAVQPSAPGGHLHWIEYYTLLISSRSCPTRSSRHTDAHPHTSSSYIRIAPPIMDSGSWHRSTNALFKSHSNFISLLNKKIFFLKTSSVYFVRFLSFCGSSTDPFRFDPYRFEPVLLIDRFWGCGLSSCCPGVSWLNR